MDIKKEREAFEIYYIANHHDGDIHPNQQLLEWSEKGEFYFATSVNDLWDMWLAAKQQAVSIDTLNEVLDWGNCAFNECWNDEQRDEIERHYKIIEAMIQEAQK